MGNGNHISINENQYTREIKFKGHNKKLDLSNLMGLQQTEENKSIFKQFDYNGDGVINSEQEVQDLQKYLANLAGSDAKLTKKEGGDVYSSLSSLADQQQAVADRKDYNENKTIKVVTDANGNTTKTEQLANGQVRTTTWNKETNTTKTTVVDEDGNMVSESTTEPTSKGHVEKVDIDCIKGTYTRSYTEKGKDNIFHTYEETFPDETAYKDEQPSSIVVDKGLPGREKTNSYTYEVNEFGAVRRTDKYGDVTYFDSKGKETEATEYYINEYTEDNEQEASQETLAQAETEPQKYTVKKGDSIKTLVKNALQEQGIGNPTEDQLNSAIEQFEAVNKNQIHEYSAQGKHKDLVGKHILYPDETVTIPQFTGMMAEKTDAADEGTDATGNEEVDATGNEEVEDGNYSDIVYQADSNKDGGIDINEFKKIVTGSEEKIKSAFQKMDTNGDGKLSGAELDAGADTMDTFRDD